MKPAPSIQSLLAGLALAIVALPAFAQYQNFVVVGPAGAAAWDSSSGTWVPQAGSFTAAAGGNGNLAVLGGSQASAFNDTSATWTPLGSGGVQLVGDNGGNFGVRGSGTVAAWNKTSSAWTSQSLPNVINLQGSAGNFGASLNGAAGSVSAWSQTTSAWSNRSVGATYGTNLVASEGNFLVQGAVDVFYAWDKSNHQWNRVDDAGVTAQLGSAGNLAFQSSANVWVWNDVMNAWHQGYAGGGNPTNVVASQGNFGFIVTNGANAFLAYAYNKNTGNWSSQAQGNNLRWQKIAASDGNIAVTVQNSGYGFAVFEGNTGAWTLYNVFGITNLMAASGGNFAYGGGGSSGTLRAWRPGLSLPVVNTGTPVPTQIVGSGGNFLGISGGWAQFWNSPSATFHNTVTGSPVAETAESQGNFAVKRADGVMQAIKGKTSGTPTWTGSGITATSPLIASSGNFGAIGANSATRYTKSVGANGTFHDLTITGVSEMTASGGNFVVRGSSAVAAIDDDNSTSWNTLTLTANRIEASDGNAAALSSADSTVAAWDQADSTWYSLTSFANNGLTLAGSGGNFAALGLNSVTAFDQADNAWFTFSGTFSGLLGGGGNFVAYGSTGAAVFESDDNSWNFLAGDYSSLAASSIPEPASVGLIGLGLLFLLRRSRASQS